MNRMLVRFVLLVVILIFLVHESKTFAQSVLWTGAVDSQFENPLNWNGDSLPTESDLIVFASGLADVSLNSKRSVAGIRSTGTGRTEISGNGGLRLSNISRIDNFFTLSGTTLENQSSILLQSATLNLNDVASINSIGDSSIIMSNSRVNLSNQSSIQVDRFSIGSGTNEVSILSQSTMRSNGVFINDSDGFNVRDVGSSWNDSDEVVLTGGFIRVSDGGSANFQSARVSGGTIFLTDAGTELSSNTVHINNDGSVRVNSGAIFRTENARVFNTRAVIDGSGSQWINSGDLDVGGFSSSNQTEVTFADSANLVSNRLNIGRFGGVLLDESSGEIQDLVMEIDATLSLRSSSITTDTLIMGGRINIDSDSVITINESMSGFAGVSGGGTFNLNGDLNLTDGRTRNVEFFADLNLSADSDVFLELSGTGASQFDRITRILDLNLDGDLSVELINGFELTEDSEFLIFDSRQLAGSFSNLEEGDSVGRFGDFDLRISYEGGNTGNSVVLYTTTAVPEPSTFIVMLLLAQGFIFYRKK